MRGKEKIYFLLDAIADKRELTPKGHLIYLHPTGDLNNKYSELELLEIYTKLENDEQVIKVIKAPKGHSLNLDPYVDFEDGYFYIELLSDFDSYYHEIQQEPEYYEFTGKKPVVVSTNFGGSVLMPYEKKLDLIINALIEARKATRTGQSTKLYINAGNGLNQIGKEEVQDILHKLQYEEKIITLSDTYNRFLPRAQQPKNPTHLLLDFCDNFDNWYEKYLMGQKTSLESLDYINMLRIYDVVLDINEQIQLTNKTTVTIHLLPSLVRFSILFPADTIGMRDKYCETRWDSLKYLKEKGIIEDFKHNESGTHRWDTTVTISLKLSMFDVFYKEIRDEYKRQNQSSGKPEESKAVTSNIDPAIESKIIWPEDFEWKANNFVFGKHGSIGFNSKDREFILKTLTDKKGGWATLSELKGNKDVGYVRSTIKQIEDRLPETAKNHIIIASTQDNTLSNKPNEGAYRIKVIL